MIIKKLSLKLFVPFFTCIEMIQLGTKIQKRKPPYGHKGSDELFNVKVNEVTI